VCGECLCGAVTLARLCPQFRDLRFATTSGETGCCSKWTARGESWRARVPAHTTSTHLLTRHSRRFLKDLHKHFPRELSRLRVLV
jgi:hypothetical protein